MAVTSNLKSLYSNTTQRPPQHHPYAQLLALNITIIMTITHLASHVENTPITPISKLAPYSALILSIVLVVLFLIRFYILQHFLLEKLHGPIYTQMNEITRRSFLNNYIAAATKIFILIIGLYPFASVAFGVANFSTPYILGSSVKMGDLLLIAAQILTGMFIFELIYRVNISPVSVAHHIGSIMVAQAAIAISIRGDRVASIEFKLCTVWGKLYIYMVYLLFLTQVISPIGAFDIIAEFLPHVVLIIYRINPTSHFLLANLFKFASITTFFGTISETILVMYMFGVLWDRWPLALKIVTPLLHVAFSAAQLHGSRALYIMWRRQQQILTEQDCEK